MKRISPVVVGLVVSALLFSTTYLTAQLIPLTGNGNQVSNPSFEQHDAIPADSIENLIAIPGWDSDAGVIRLHSGSDGGISAHSGDTKLELDADGNSDIHQSLTTAAGQRYSLGLFYSPQVISPAGTDTNDVTVWWNGSMLDTLSGDRRYWQHYHYDAISENDNSILRLEGAGTSDGQGGFIDDIDLEAVPYTTFNLVENGSFEQYGTLNHGDWGTFAGIPGWDAAAGSVEIQTNGIGGQFSYEGKANLEADADFNSSIYQDISTDPSLHYELSLRYSPRITSPAGTDTNDVEVWWDGVRLTTLGGDRHGWQRRVFDVTATTALTRLMLVGAGTDDSYGGLIDDVRLYGTCRAGANLIVNGSFEQHDALNHGQWGTFASIPGWNADVGDIEIQHYTGNVPMADEGVAKLEPDADFNSTVTQIIPTQAGKTYSLQWAYSPRVNSPGTHTNDVEVWWDNTLLTTLTGDQQGWRHFHMPVTAGGAGTPLTFKAAGDSDSYGGLIDDVRLYEVHLSPVITSNAPTTAQFNATYSYQVTTDQPSGTQLHYQLAQGPAGMTVNEDTGLLTWVPDQTGNFDVTINVSNACGGSAGQTFTITVSNANQPPVITSTPVTAGQVGTAYNYDVNATDADGDTLNYNLAVAPAGMTIDAATGLIQWTPAAKGSYPVQVEVSDGRGGVDSQAFTVTVPNRPPQIITTPVTSAVAGSAYSYAVQAVDADGDTLTFSLPVAPTGMTIDPAAGVIDWLPAASGSFDVTVQVDDGDGGSDSQTFTINVTAANQAPVITSSPVLTAIINVAYIYTVTATDADGDSLAYSLTAAPAGMSIDPVSGLISWTPAALGDVTVSVVVSDGNGGSASQTFTVTVVDQVIPPDPVTVAPPLSTTGVTGMLDATAFLYTGASPIQTGVAPGTIEARRAAVIRGLVKDRNNVPLSGVTVTVHDHPEFGQTLSRADGMFDLAVNGGGILTLNYQKDGYLPVQRQVDTPWRDYISADDVVMIPVDTQVTAIDLTSAQPFQVARGSVQTDSAGSRRATVMFSQGTTAAMVMPDGSTQPLTTLNVRATEYTVGDNGFETMPAMLPPNSAYTYAVELSVDEAIAAGANQVEFSQPVPFYVENFLNFPTGQAVPVGYYDREQATWLPSETGRIIEILSIESGLAVLDVLGNGSPAPQSELDQLGITDAERAQLATLYAPGDTLWRARITHFTPYDCNWPYGAPADAEPPSSELPEVLDDDQPDDSDDEDECEGCDISPQGQSVGESLPITGTPFSLHYGSDRMPGRTDRNVVNIPLSGSSIPASLQAIKLSIDIAGRQVVQTFTPQPDLSYTFGWDGKDAYGRNVYGSTQATVIVTYFYPCVYKDGGNGFARFTSGIVPIGTRTDCKSMTFPQRLTVSLDSPAPLSNMDIGGWSLNVNHAWFSEIARLSRGDGRSRTISDLIDTIAGTGVGGFAGDGGPATEAQFFGLGGIDIDAAGNIYIADRANHRVRRIDPNGIITTVAGTGVQGFSGDGGPATQAQLFNPSFVAVDKAGNLYITDGSNRRIRKVDTNGIITTYAGTGTIGISPDGIPATEADLRNPTDLAVDSAGNLYIADLVDDRVRKVSPDGIITTVAGRAGQCLFAGDGGPAFASYLCAPIGIAVDAQDNLYIADNGNFRIRRVSRDGIITTVAGNGVWAHGGDGGLATDAQLNSPGYVTLDADGNLYITEEGNRIRRVSASGIITTIAGNGTAGFSGDGGSALQAQFNTPADLAVDAERNLYIVDTGNVRIRQIGSVRASNVDRISSKDGTQQFIFDNGGRQLFTLDTITGVVEQTFGRDSEGRLISITDRDGDVTTIERNVDGEATAIIAPDGQRTELTLDANGYLASVTNPANETYAMVYDGKGLMTAFRDRKSQENTFEYDGLGRLARDINAGGGGWTLTRTELTDGYSIAMTSGEGRVRTFTLENLPTGIRRQTNTAANGTQDITLFSPDSTQTTTTADGMEIFLREGPDPRFVLASPVPEETRITTPNGLVNTINVSNEVVLANPADPLSHTSLTRRVTHNGKIAESVYDAASRTWTITTAQNRGLTSVLDTNGYVVQSAIAGLAPVTTAYTPEGRAATFTQGTGADTRLTQLSYYGSGPAQGFLQSVTDAENRQISFEYDAAGRVTKQILPDLREILFSYDANGNVTSITPPGRPAHSFNYNAADQESDYTAPAVAGVVNSTTVRTYNLDKQLELVTRPDGKTIDFVNNATTGQVDSIIIPRGTYNYSYDSTSGNVTQITAPDNGTLGFTYDGRLLLSTTWTGEVSGSVSQTYNNDFVVTQQQVNGANAISYGYDDDLLLTQAGDLTLTRSPQNALITATTLTAGPNTVSTSHSYNAFAEVSADSADYNSTAVYAAGYLHDKVGRITQMTETVDGVTTTFNYLYDDAGRLVEVQTGGVTTTTYTYDANSNRTHVNGTLLGAYDDQDRLTRYGDNQYTYTDNGELLEKTNTISSTTTRYDYDVLSNLVAVTLPDTTRIDYVIDGKNRRVGKKVNGALVQGFLYGDSLNPVAELDGSGAVVSRFVYGSKSNVPDYLIKGGVTYRIISDHLGSPRLVIDMTDGSVTQRMDYDVFGNVIADTNPGFQPFGFAGGLYDRDTGLVRFGARDYDPETGRWTNKDVIGFQAADTNLYGYVLNDPVNFVDASGKFFNLGLAAVGAIVGAGVGAINAAITGGSISQGALDGAFLGLTAGFSFGGTLVAELVGAAVVSAGAQAILEARDVAAKGECFNTSNVLLAGALGAAGATAGEFVKNQSILNVIEKTKQYAPSPRISDGALTVISTTTSGAGSVGFTALGGQPAPAR